MRRIGNALVLSCLVLAWSATSSAQDRLWFGGGVGFSFGDVDYYDVNPIFGYSATDKLSFGGGVTYRYRKDGRISGSPSTEDYGASVFCRYRLRSTLFAQAEYEHLNYEFVRGDLSRDRDTFNSLLAGPGFLQPLGHRTALFGVALYNFSYDEDEPGSPYDDEWVYRVGLTVGF